MNTTVFFCKNDAYIGFKSSGHSGFAESGKDILCAAISVLTQSTVNALEHFVGSDRLTVYLNNQDGELKVYLAAALDANTAHDAQVLLHSLFMGLKNLEETYPKYLKVLKQEVDSDA